MSPERVLEIYLISFRDSRIRLFSPAHGLEFFESQSDDRIRRFLDWMQRHRFFLISWFGKVLHSGRGYYMRLEAKLDPVERILKAMDSAERYTVFYSTSWEEEGARKHLMARVRRQGGKHAFWCTVDFILSVAALAIAFLPGPNVVGWYPFLRSLSHYRAFCGTRAMLRSSRIAFKGLPELRTLEENLQAPGFNRKGIHAVVECLKISGLEQFLERMV